MSRTIVWVLALMGLAGSALGDLQGAGDVLVQLDAAGLPEGALREWRNTGTLGGAFLASRQPPEVAVIDGVPVVVFIDHQYLTSNFKAPESITGNAPWSLEVWAFKHEFGQQESTLVSWAHRNLGTARTAQFSWGSNNLAAIHWGQDLAWQTRPKAGAWQHLVIVYDGSEQHLYVNGQQDRKAERRLDIATGHPVVVGAATTDQGAERCFIGAMASVRLHDGAMTGEMVQANYERHRGAWPDLPPAPPAVSIVRPTGIRTRAAYLSAQVTATGGLPTRATVYWGPRDAGMDPEAWPHAREVSEVTLGDLSLPVGDLEPATDYAYRFRVFNEAGANWTSAAATFTTRQDRSGEAPDQQPFRLVVWPDSQWASEKWPEILPVMAQWIVDQRDAMNIKYVLHVGDMVQSGHIEEEWRGFDAAMRVLDGEVPYALAVGNHDLDRLDETRTVLFNRTFPPSRFERMPGFGGSFLEGRSDSTYHTFRAIGRDWLILTLMYNPDQDVLAWANEVVKEHPGHLVIVNTHSYLTHAGRDRSGQVIWDALVKQHPNMFVVVCGHLSTVHFQDKGEHGNAVYEMLFDWQNPGSMEPNSYLALLEFDPVKGTIRAEAYSPVLDRFLTDPRSDFVLEQVPQLMEQPPDSVEP